MQRMYLALAAALTLLASNPSGTPVSPSPRPAAVSPRTLRKETLRTRQEHAQKAVFTYTANLQQVYLNNQYGFSVRYPRAWTVQNMRQQQGNALATILLFLSPLEGEQDAARENINLVIEQLPSSAFTLDAYTEAAIENEKTVFSTYDLTASHGLQFGGIPAHRVAFTGTMNEGDPVSFEQIWFIRDGAAHVWTLAAQPGSFDRYSQIFRQMLDSLAFRT